LRRSDDRLTRVFLEKRGLAMGTVVVDAFVILRR
jgi:hypothetical protein